MYGNHLNETTELGIPLDVRWLRRDPCLMRARGAAVWAGRGYRGGEHGRVHPFDGLPKIFSIRLHEGQARLHTRFIHNKVQRRAMERGYVAPFVCVSPEVSGRSSWSPRHILGALFDPGTGALEVQNVHGCVIVGYEGPGYAAEIDAESLETVAEYRMRHHEAPWNVPLGSAYLPNGEDNTWYAATVELDIRKLGMRPKLVISRIEPDMRLVPFEPVVLDALIDVHNIAVTPRFVVAIVCPERIRLDKVLACGNVLESVEDRPDADNVFCVWDRRTGKLLHRLPSRFHFTFNHFVRATEDASGLVLDLIESTSARARISVPSGPDDRFVMGGRVVRYRVDLASFAITRTELFEGPCEMPVAEHHDGPAYANYFEDGADGQAWGLCSIYDGRKLIPEDGSRIISSPVITDGIIHVLTCDRDYQRYAWWALDGESFELLARAELPEAVGIVAHGNWFERPKAPVWYTEPAQARRLSARSDEARL